MDSTERVSDVPDVTESMPCDNERSSSLFSSQSSKGEKVKLGDIEKDGHLDRRDEIPKQISTVGPDPVAFPDGGFHAWLCVTGGFCTIFASFGWINCTEPI